MGASETCEILINSNLQTPSVGLTKAQTASHLKPQSAEEVQRRIPKHSRGDSRYWLAKGRLRKPTDSPYWGMQVQMKGRRFTFTTQTANKEAGARIAAGIYNDLVILGIDAALAKHRPQPVKTETVATVGKWIEAARKVSSANSSTFNCYGASLRKIVGDIVCVDRTKNRFGPGKEGGAAGYRAKIDVVGLDVLTFTAVQKWRIAYVAQAKNPAQKQSRETSCNSTIRQARSLFTKEIVYNLKELLLPALPPFEIPPEIKPEKGKKNPLLFKKHNTKYSSRIDAKTLLQAAHADLYEKDPPAFLAVRLALSAGLRRGEIDSLCWHQVDFKRELIRIESTEAASLKTRDSQAEVPVDPQVAAIFQDLRKQATGQFVIEAEGTENGPRKWGQHYRADAVFNRLTAWLRAHGVKARKPLHELRKELGAMVTAEHGIYAASRVLRHSKVTTTAEHYSDLKTRPVVNVGGWLQPAGEDSRTERSVAKKRQKTRKLHDSA